MTSNKKEVQYRYYDMPPGSYVLPLLGSGWIREYGSDINAQHFHNYMEIGYCYEGEGYMEYGKDIIPFQPYSFSLIPANYLHHTQSTPGTQSRWEFLFLDVDSFINDMYEGNQRQAKKLLARIKSKAHFFHEREQTKIASLILELIELHRFKPELYTETTKGLVWALLIKVAALVPQQDPLPENQPSMPFKNSENSANSTISQALDYVNSHFKERIQIAELAAACHLSETHFRRTFTQTMHMTPLEYVNLVRIEAACKLLRTTSEPIQDIAMQCGFLTLASFNRNFKEYMETTPHAWRKDTAFYEKQLEKQHIIVFNGWQ